MNLLDIPDSPLPPLEQARRDLMKAHDDIETLILEKVEGTEFNRAHERMEACRARVRALEGEALRRSR